MNAIATSPEHTRSRRAIAAHFAGRATPAAETSMRAHLSACGECRHVYDRHLILARLDPRARSAEERLAAGLGIRRRARVNWDRWSRWAIGLAVPVAAAALLVAFRSGQHDVDSRPGDDGATALFAARGGRPSAGGTGAPTFWAYRIAAARAPQLADRAIAAGDELAFAYSNAAGKPYLMIFGVDEHRHVYWFHPAWPAGRAAPVAIRANPGPGPHELSDAVRHAIDGERLDVYAVFSERAITATDVEERIRRAGADRDGGRVTGAAMQTVMQAVMNEGTVVDRRTFRVLP